MWKRGRKICTWIFKEFRFADISSDTDRLFSAVVKILSSGVRGREEWGGYSVRSWQLAWRNTKSWAEALRLASLNLWLAESRRHVKTAHQTYKLGGRRGEGTEIRLKFRVAVRSWWEWSSCRAAMMTKRWHSLQNWGRALVEIEARADRAGLAFLNPGVAAILNPKMRELESVKLTSCLFIWSEKVHGWWIRELIRKETVFKFNRRLVNKWVEFETSSKYSKSPLLMKTGEIRLEMFRNLQQVSYEMP